MFPKNLEPTDWNSYLRPCITLVLSVWFHFGTVDLKNYNQPATLWWWELLDCSSVGVSTVSDLCGCICFCFFFKGKFSIAAFSFFGVLFKDLSTWVWLSWFPELSVQRKSLLKWLDQWANPPMQRHLTAKLKCVAILKFVKTKNWKLNDFVTNAHSDFKWG